jgi:cation diffusion facilitator family transporter
MEPHESNEELRTKDAPLLRVGIYSLLVNLGLVGAKFALSVIAGSLALRADAIHSLVDVFGSIALILGLIISGRKTKSFPYGLYKVENLVSVIISLLLFLAAYEIVIEAITGETTATLYTGWVLGAVGALIIVPFLFGRYEVGVGKRVNSPSIIADGTQFKADVLSSAVVFVALIGQHFGLPLDRIAAAVITVFIVRAGWGLMVNSMRVLLDASVDRDTLERIRSVIQAEPALSTIESVTGRNSGRYLFVEATVTLRVSDLEKAHLVSERIESRIRKTVPNVDRVLIHYEPRRKTQILYAVALTKSQEEISQHFGESPYFALVEIDPKERKVQRQEVVANPHVALAKARGIKVAEFLLSYKPDIVVARESLSGKGPGYTLADAGVETMQTETTSLRDLIGHLLEQLR